MAKPAEATLGDIYLFAEGLSGAVVGGLGKVRYLN